ncbi:MAG: DNA cytosine methyltransferase [Deltaproteobacteria bacterium]|jgi:DNA (cytosine-5)-methyltransferase 1|nr:DNA cytosine methyltransferase [Deltaproteobacteria bacterium]
MARQPAQAKSGPRLISLFSGCGGLDLGFEQAGFRRVWANDFDPHAQAVYSLNLGRIDCRDITEVESGEIPEGEVITAGFPCQPFSNAGNRRGVRDSRGMLYQECMRIVRDKMPEAVLFENVKGLLSTRHADGRRLAEVILDDLRTLGGTGYDAVCRLVRASDHGVPQNRERVIFVGVRRDLGIRFEFPAAQDKVGLTLRHVLDLPRDAPNQVDWPLSPQAMSMVERIGPGGSWKDVPYPELPDRFKRIRDDMKRYHSPNFYRRFAPDEICGTITASAQPENCGIVHPTENRRFTIREVARIQTFPDGFRFIDATSRDIAGMYKVIGNAVPVKLARAIASAIMEQVFAGKARGCRPGPKMARVPRRAARAPIRLL